MKLYWKLPSKENWRGILGFSRAQHSSLDAETRRRTTDRMEYFTGFYSPKHFDMRKRFEDLQQQKWKEARITYQNCLPRSMMYKNVFESQLNDGLSIKWDQRRAIKENKVKQPRHRRAVANEQVRLHWKGKRCVYYTLFSYIFLLFEMEGLAAARGRVKSLSCATVRNRFWVVGFGLVAFVEEKRVYFTIIHRWALSSCSPTWAFNTLAVELLKSRSFETRHLFLPICKWFFFSSPILNSILDVRFCYFTSSRRLFIIVNISTFIVIWHGRFMERLQIRR